MAKLIIVDRMSAEWCFYKLRSEEVDLVENSSLMWITKEDWGLNDESRSKRLNNSKEIYYCTPEEYNNLSFDIIHKQCIKSKVKMTSEKFYKLVNSLIVK